MKMITVAEYSCQNIRGQSDNRELVRRGSIFEIHAYTYKPVTTSRVRGEVHNSLMEVRSWLENYLIVEADGEKIKCQVEQPLSEADREDLELYLLAEAL